MKYLGEPENIDAMTEFLANDEVGLFTGQAISVSGWLAMYR